MRSFSLFLPNNLALSDSCQIPVRLLSDSCQKYLGETALESVAHFLRVFLNLKWRYCRWSKQGRRRRCRARPRATEEEGTKERRCAIRTIIRSRIEFENYEFACIVLISNSMPSRPPRTWASTLVNDFDRHCWRPQVFRRLCNSNLMPRT